MWVLFSVAAVSSYCKRLTLPPQLKVTSDGCDGKLCHVTKRRYRHPSLQLERARTHYCPHQLLTSRAPNGCFSNRIN